ncbi:hypothetical protein EV359DRAFT_77075 [Lentinula novae-zelandiae]|nr:hypothetical protein EV359DRAFT_77075 [Lentinula novae-zelandiae]
MANSPYSGYNPNLNLNIPYSSYDGGRGYGLGHGPRLYSDSSPENPYEIQEQEKAVVGPHSSPHPENPANNSGHRQHPLGRSSQDSRVYNPSSESRSSFAFSSLGPTRPAQVPSEREHPHRHHFPQTGHTNNHLNQLKQSRDFHNSHVSDPSDFSNRHHHHDVQTEWDYGKFPGRRQPEVPNGIAGTPKGSGCFDNDRIYRDGSAAALVRPWQSVDAEAKSFSGCASSSSSSSAKSNKPLFDARRAPSDRVVVPSYNMQQELVHWDETLNRRSGGSGLGSGSGSAWSRECVDSSNSNLTQTETLRPAPTLTEQLMACGAKDLKEIFEIWEECRAKARKEGTVPRLVFQRESEQKGEGERERGRREERDRHGYQDKQKGFSQRRQLLRDDDKLPKSSSRVNRYGSLGVQVSDEDSPQVFQEIVSRFSKVFRGLHIDDKGYYFLDVGCRSGGFASFILQNNAFAMGVGISPLPQESVSASETVKLEEGVLERGIPLQLERERAHEEYYARYQSYYSPFTRSSNSRFKLYFLDMAKIDLRRPGEKNRRGLFNTTSELTSWAGYGNKESFQGSLGYGSSETTAAANFPSELLDLKRPPQELLFGFKQGPDSNRHTMAGASSRKFNLVILDDYTSSFSLSSDLHLIAQLLLGFQSLTQSQSGGGTLVVRLRHPESVITAKILYMLDTLSSTVAAVKPRGMLGDAEDPGCFYVIAQNVGGGPHGHKIGDVVEELRKLWWKLVMRVVRWKGLVGSVGSDVKVEDGGVEGETEMGETGEIECNQRGLSPECGLKEEDFDFILYTDELKGSKSDYLVRLVALGEMVWTRQLEMILMARENRK